MKKTFTYCDVCGEQFAIEAFSGVHDKTRTRVVGNVVIELAQRGDRQFIQSERLFLEVCEDPKKDCRHKAVDLLIERVIQSEKTP